MLLKSSQVSQWGLKIDSEAINSENFWGPSTISGLVEMWLEHLNLENSFSLMGQTRSENPGPGWRSLESRWQSSQQHNGTNVCGHLFERKKWKTKGLKVWLICCQRPAGPPLHPPPLHCDLHLLLSLIFISKSTISSESCGYVTTPSAQQSEQKNSFTHPSVHRCLTFISGGKNITLPRFYSAASSLFCFRQTFHHFSPPEKIKNIIISASSSGRQHQVYDIGEKIMGKNIELEDVP